MTIEKFNLLRKRQENFAQLKSTILVFAIFV